MKRIELSNHRESARNAIKNIKAIFDLEFKYSTNDDWNLDSTDLEQVSEFLQVGFEPNNNIRGIYATKTLKKGLVIGEYTGTIIKKKRIVNDRLDQDPSFYIVQLGERTWLDAEFTGNILSLINHSCVDVNCIMYRISPTRVAIKLTRDVNSNEFLHLNYKMQFRTSNPKTIKCLCDKNCRNFIG